MKSVLVLSLVSSILSLAAASKIDKAQLCNEVCWINDINNHDACAKRCIQGARPTEDEAGLCTKCIENCGLYLSRNKSVILYQECRTGCFAKYFPQFVTRGGRQKGSHRQKEHIPGIPSHLSNSFGGKQTYPVDENICELSCRAQGADNILEEDVDESMKSCMKQCIDKPTLREQELQMSSDCRETCTKGEPDCFQCFVYTANERTPDVDFGKVVPLPASSATANSADATGVSSKGSLEDIKSGGNFTRANETLKPKPTKAVDFRPAKADAEDVDATSSSEPSATPSFSGKKNRTKTRVSSESGASGKPYLETFLFWMYVVGTISFATIIGLQVI